MDIDNADTDDDFATGGDDPWDFGENDEYPVLKYGGLDTAAQVNRQPTVGTLTSLTLTGATLSSAFDTTTLAYTATLPDGSTATTVTVAGTPTNPTDTVSYSAVAGSASAVTADADGDTAGHQVILGGPNTVITITVTPQSGVAQSYTVTIAVPTNDYDDDDDNLIDVTTLAQLNAIRYDLNGNGAADSAANNAAYAAAYLYPAAGMGCAATCAGYELLADLDFDTDGNDDVADAPYANWVPIGIYTSTFQGNGHTISNLTVTGNPDPAGLFWELSSSGSITGVGLINPSVSSGAEEGYIGGLVGINNGGTISASYVSGGSVASSGQDAFTGGLVGINIGTIRASYSTAAVSGSGSAGGLVGVNHLTHRYPGSGTIIASYAATGSIAGAGTRDCLSSSTALTGVGNGGLGTVTNSYWDSTRCSHTGGGGAGQTTSALQTPTAYGTTGIYSAWNVDVGGTSANDDPWDFGTSSQYPILQYGRDAIGIQAQRNPNATAVDYDTNDNNLIDITTLARLDAIRYDGDGDGVSVKGAGAVKYANAFPGVSAGMGCAAACIGYELRNNLDFNTGMAVRTDDAYYNGGAGWTPIGTGAARFTGTFRGNGHTLSNLQINAPAATLQVGLFGVINGPVSGIGLPNASVTGAHNELFAGALVGELYPQGSVTASWATGSVTAGSATGHVKRIGGLVGNNVGVVRASYADVSVTAATASTATKIYAGGLAGSMGTTEVAGAGSVTASYATGAVAGGASATSYVGGLAGRMEGTPTITASYTMGTVTVGASGNRGGLAGNLPSGATVTNSYWHIETSGIITAGAGQGKLTGDLQTPTGYAGIYSSWNVDVDGETGNDDPWDFGYGSQYPALQYGGLDLLKQGRDTIVLSTDELDADEGADTTYTVRLGGPPTAAVTVTVTSPTGDDVTIDGPDSGAGFSESEEVRFSTTNWNQPQTVTVRVASDTDLADGTATLTHTAAGAGSGFAGRTASLSVAIDDTTPRSIVLTRSGGAITELDITEDAAAVYYDVALSNAPLANVTVTITVGSTPTNSVEIYKTGAAAFASSQTLTFTPMNYNTTQGIAIRAPNDPNPDDETGITLSHAATDATSTASGYDGISKDLTVNVTDDDTPNILLSAAALTVTEEDSDGGSYTVRLSTEPTADVAVTVTASGSLTIDGPDAATDFTVSETLTFTASDWNTATTTIKVIAAADDDLVNNTIAIAHSAASADSAYHGASKSLPVTVTDNDTPTIIISETGTLSVDEGGNGTYTVKLSHRPAAGVTVTVTSSLTDDVEIDGPDAGATFSDSETLSFATTNWNTPQTVTVKGATDNDLADSTGNTLSHAASNTVSSMDSLFTGAATVSLSVTVTDTTAPSILLTQSGSDITTLGITEESSNVNYQVALSNAPLADVTVTVTTSDNAAVTIDGPDGNTDFTSSETMTFATGVTTAQTVTIKAPGDSNSVNESVTLTHAATGAGSGYASVSDATLTVNVTDNDTPNILLSATSLTVTEEDSSGGSYTVYLATAPAADVTVTVTASGSLTIDGPDAATAFTTSETLTFTSTNIAAQTINVRAGADDDLANNTITIAHTAASTDSDYAGKTKNLSVTVMDNDTGSLILSHTARTVKEGDDAGATYTVKLSHRPSATVTVTIADANDKAAATPASLTFNAANWNTAQTVTVTAAADADLTNDNDTLTHTPSATGGYLATAAEDVTVTVHDTTAPAMTFSESRLSIEERATDTYTVALAAAPPADTTVAITSSNPAITVNPETLTFPVADYNTPQTVTVTTTADDDAFHNASWLTHTPTIRGVAGGATLLPVLLREPDPSESEEPARIRITPPPAGAPDVEYTIDTHTVTVSRAAGVPDGVTVNTLQSLAANLTITFSVPSGIPTTLSGFSLDGDTLVDIAPDSVPAGGLEICLPRGDGATQLLHYRSGRWQVVPGSGPRGDQVCGTVSRFSPFIAGQPAAAVAPETEPERPPIIYNLNIRFDARRIALPEGHTASYRVRLAGRPAGRGATIRIRSDNPDVQPDPTELRFTAADWEQWQTVSIAIAGDANHTDESATLAHYGPNRGYGSVLVSVTDTGDSRQAGDTLAPALTVITEPGARWGVTVTPTAPADLAAHGVVRVSPAYGVPRTAAGYGLGRNGAAQAIVSIAAPADVPASGLTVCLPVARALAEEAGERRLTLLRYGDADTGGGWQAVSGAEYDAVGRSVCAAGVTGFGAFAAAYILPQ